MLWLCGPPGVGKTEVGWELFSQLRRAGVEAGYVDVDQLGICYPEPAADPGRHLLQARNVGAVLAGFRAAGARCAVVSGVVDPTHGVHAGLIPGAALTVCRLRAGHDELTRRLLGRAGSTVALAEALRNAVAMDAGDIADGCVDTSGLSVAEVVERVREETGGWPALPTTEEPSRAPFPAPSQLTSPAPSPDPYPEVSPDPDPDPVPVPGAGSAGAADGSVLWLCGATGVGKSTVGFQLFRKALGGGRTAAYLDLDQIGFCGPTPADDPGNHRVKSRNLAALWRAYRAVGARCLTVVGHVEDESVLQAYTDALAPATVTLCRLHAGREELTRRILSRGRGGSWPQPGDPLRGRPAERLLQAADAAVTDAAALERAALGIRVDTDGRTVEEVAEEVVEAVAALALRPPRT
ncbi:hypothetical protein ABT174_32835 [Streptomyces sparsogenes]|uniref:hypothetical protein n=1 Tax=Streptomyces sparsogenes TaxID=67365 RepID=UPI00331D9601